MNFKVCIIGAGPSGLAMAKSLQEHFISYDHFDSHIDVGGLWDINRKASPLYESAHLISSRHKSSFESFPMPDHYPDYPHHSQVLSYLKSYASFFGLYRYLTFGTRVIKLEKKADSRWLVYFSDGTAKIYNAVICATGGFWQPYIPSIASDFQGLSLHSVGYTSAVKFCSQKVMVVGSGNSAIDIACDLSKHQSRVYLSMKDGRHFVPKHIFGTPIDTLSSENSLIPEFLKRFTTKILLNICIGNLQKYGLPKAKHNLSELPAIPNTEIFSHITHGRMEIRKEIKKIKGTQVEFTDGSKEFFDTLIWATGFTGQQHLLKDLIDFNKSKDELYLGFISKDHQNLFCTNFFESDTGHFRLFETMAKITAKILVNQIIKKIETNSRNKLEQYCISLNNASNRHEKHKFYNSKKWHLCAEDYLLTLRKFEIADGD